MKDNPLNDNFAKKEFQELWNRINHKYAYTVSFDSDELIEKAINHINDKLFVAELLYTTQVGRQKSKITQDAVNTGSAFASNATRTQKLDHSSTSHIKYDLVGKVAEGTTLTRKTTVAILKGIKPEKFNMFKVQIER